MFNNQTVLITGATGSFGRKFIEIVLKRYAPKKVVVYSRDEFKQFEMQQVFNQPCMRYFLGDVRDAQRLHRAMEGVDYVVHAAALKQVPALEYNPIEAVRTNILGAEHVIQASVTNGVKKVIALSTDKAANPINLYGATKLASDKLFVAANNLVGDKSTQFSVVRYGNVLGSRGSVIPFFQKMLEEGARELPVTDPRMTRFWITLEQGVEFVLQAFHRMQGGGILVPKIPSMTILDIVETLAPGIRTKVVGIRPSEKLHEVMCPSEISRNTLEFDDHYVITPAFNFNRDIDYTRNGLKEEGRPVPDGFEYNSGTNTHFLTPPEMGALLDLPALKGSKRSATT